MTAPTQRTVQCPDDLWKKLQIEAFKNKMDDKDPKTISLIIVEMLTERYKNK